jgi:hypothetical protein
MHLDRSDNQAISRDGGSLLNIVKEPQSLRSSSFQMRGARRRQAIIGKEEFLFLRWSEVWATRNLWGKNCSHGEQRRHQLLLTGFPDGARELSPLFKILKSEWPVSYCVGDGNWKTKENKANCLRKDLKPLSRFKPKAKSCASRRGLCVNPRVAGFFRRS